MTTLSDVYGLGAVLYALLTGKPPFGGDSVMETLDQVRQQPPVPPSRTQSEGSPRSGDHLPEVPGEGPAAALPLRAGVGRRASAVPGWRADPGTAGERVREGLAVVPAASGDRRADGGAGGGGSGGADRHQSGLAGALDARQDALNREQDALKAQAKETGSRPSWPSNVCTTSE